MQDSKEEFFRDYRLYSIEIFTDCVAEKDIFPRKVLDWYIYMVRMFPDSTCKFLIKYRDGSMKSCRADITKNEDGVMFVKNNEVHETENGLVMYSDDFYVSKFVKIAGKRGSIVA